MNSEEVFITLIRVAEEDENIRRFLRTVAGLDTFQRNSLINGFIMEMTLKGAPSEFINAIAALRNPGVIDALREWLDGKS